MSSNYDSKYIFNFFENSLKTVILPWSLFDILEINQFGTNSKLIRIDLREWTLNKELASWLTNGNRLIWIDRINRSFWTYIVVLNDILMLINSCERYFSAYVVYGEKLMHKHSQYGWNIVQQIFTKRNIYKVRRDTHKSWKLVYWQNWISVNWNQGINIVNFFKSIEFYCFQFSWKMFSIIESCFIRKPDF